MPWVTASPWNHLMILAQCEHPRWKTHFRHNFFLIQEGWGGGVVGNAYATLCLSPLSPRGVKARRAMSMEREKGCDECSNRWDESSVLVRYVLLLSYCPFSFAFFHSLLLLLSCVFYLYMSNFSFMSHFPLSSSARFDFVSPLSSGSSFCVCSFYLTPSFFLYCMPCSWNVAQNHINTLLPITHTRVQKAEKGRESTAKKKKPLYSDVFTLKNEHFPAGCSSFLGVFFVFFRVTTNY